MYEELLVKEEKTDKTEDERIFIERGKALTEEEINRKLSILTEAVKNQDNEAARKALHEAVETYIEK